ncbi:hypothetical protein ALO_04508 [Acetonema longum DSM 6540]|uniref:Uncharacterized protein n=1 Tax=Acetonema longum DSM 6540 TaxID=1009370 RepID=F7NFS0_9FIRM|nr:hypothetical protein ALO_04508 [Acetonema longum DSM 6540]
MDASKASILFFKAKQDTITKLTICIAFFFLCRGVCGRPIDMLQWRHDFLSYPKMLASSQEVPF